MVMVMSNQSNREDPTPKFLFSVRDVVRGQDIGQFSKVSGGERTVSVISYNEILSYGGSVTRYFPGHSTYAPIKLSRPMDKNCKPIQDYLWDSVTGKVAVARTNFSITLFDHKAGTKVIWNLLNALPTAVSGFNFDQAATEFTDFEVTIQAEHIEVLFV